MCVWSVCVVCLCVCRRQIAMISIFLSLSPPHLLRQALSLRAELPVLARLASQQASEMCLSLSFQGPATAFRSEIQTQILMLELQTLC